jgi:hypothetical protein
VHVPFFLVRVGCPGSLPCSCTGRSADLAHYLSGANAQSLASVTRGSPGLAPPRWAVQWLASSIAVTDSWAATGAVPASWTTGSRGRRPCTPPCRVRLSHLEDQVRLDTGAPAGVPRQGVLRRVIRATRPPADPRQSKARGAPEERVSATGRCVQPIAISKLSS